MTFSSNFARVYVGVKFCKMHTNDILDSIARHNFGYYKIQQSVNEILKCFIVVLQIKLTILILKV